MTIRSGVSPSGRRVWGCILSTPRGRVSCASCPVRPVLHRFLVTALASTYLYGLLCSGKSLRDEAKSALLLGVAKPLRAVLAALCYYGMLLLAVLFFPLSGAYLLLIGFSLPCLLGTFYIRTVLAQYCDECE